MQFWKNAARLYKCNMPFSTLKNDSKKYRTVFFPDVSTGKIILQQIDAEKIQRCYPLFVTAIYLY